MKYADKLEALLKQHYDTQRKHIRCSDTLDQQVISQIRDARQSSQTHAEKRIGSFIMKHRLTGMAAAIAFP